MNNLSVPAFLAIFKIFDKIYGYYLNSYFIQLSSCQSFYSSTSYYHYLIQKYFYTFRIILKLLGTTSQSFFIHKHQSMKKNIPSSHMISDSI